jgi:cob(I)alamin adenosyltransferase
MTHFYTRTGDDGFTGLLGKGRVPKYDHRMETVGAVDEATAALGVARAACQAPGTAELLLAVQRDLYHLMAEISATPETAQQFRQIDASRVSWLEEQIDLVGEKVAMPQEFIVPGDSTTGAALAVARTITRRAERQMTKLVHSGEVENREILRYLNRLSSLCFALELLENQAAGRNSPTLAKQDSTEPHSDQPISPRAG